LEHYGNVYAQVTRFKDIGKEHFFDLKQTAWRKLNKMNKILIEYRRSEDFTDASPKLTTLPDA
jgi:hypothetical protein